MTKEQINKLVAMYLVAIGEGIPSSHLWLAVDPQMSDVDLHQKLLAVLSDNQIIKVSNHFVTLLPKGKEMVRKIKEIYEAPAAQQPT